jgi:hypothetical protein
MTSGGEAIVINLIPIVLSVYTPTCRNKKPWRNIGCYSVAMHPNRMRLEEMENISPFRSPNGECGWTRDQALTVIALLRNRSLAILGGELWVVLNGSRDWSSLIPQRQGPDAIYAWETKRYSEEDWPTFVNRCAADSVAAVERWPDSDVSPKIEGQILYNLTWTSEEEYRRLS